MRTLRLYGIRDLRIREEDIPVPSDDEVLVQVSSVGVCGSDLHWFSDGTTGESGIEVPFILGHEFSGIVASGDLMGRRVAVDPQVPCKICEFCQQGNPNLCPDHYFAGQHPRDGALQEYLAWPVDNIYILPDTISDDAGAMLEPRGVAIHTVDLGEVKPGMTVGVFVCGPVGLLVLQVARLAGATRIIATDKFPHRLDAARQLGAQEALLAAESREVHEILRLTHGRGVDVAFEIAGENYAVETAVDTCIPGGRVVLCGIPADNHTSFNATSARRKGLTIKLVRRMKHTYPRAIALVENGLVDVLSLVTHRFSLEAYREAFRTANQRDGLKVMIDFRL